jgi:FixJ family two-component response regulator
LKTTTISQPDATNAVQPLVVVIDDDRLFGRSIKRLLESHGYQATVYESLDQFTAADNVPQVGCAILDLNLPDFNGLEIQARLATIAPSLCIVFLTGFGEVSATVRAMKAGAVDFLEKPVEDAVLLRALGLAIERSKRLFEERFEREELRRRLARLSARERQVFLLVTSGFLNKQAGAELGVTEKTIKVHRAHVMQKMEVGSLAELVKIAQRLGPDLQADGRPSIDIPGQKTRLTPVSR